jgi:hypothetical protein
MRIFIGWEKMGGNGIEVAAGSSVGIYCASLNECCP